MTESEYRANLLTRFPHLTSMEAVAAHENAAMRKSIGQPAGGFGSACVSAHARRLLSERALERGRQSMEEVIAILVDPMTVEQIMDRLGWTATTTRRALNRAMNEGRIHLAKKVRPQVWHINTKGRQG